MDPKSTDHLHSLVDNEIDSFLLALNDKIEKENEKIEIYRKQKQFESKLAQERKLNEDLTKRLSELNSRSDELNRVCDKIKSHLVISDRDTKRLESAKLMYQIAKELTGIRLDFTAPPDVAKGYIKSKVRKVLLPFEVPAGDSEALWSLIGSTTGNDENRPINRR